MKHPPLIGLLGTSLLAISAVGCKDPSAPTTLADQQKLVRGSTPTPEQLNKAMSKYKFQGPGDKPMAMPTGATGGGH